jgi:hypothetical protein
MISKDSIVNANGAVTSATNFFISSGAIDRLQRIEHRNSSGAAIEDFLFAFNLDNEISSINSAPPTTLSTPKDKRQQRLTCPARPATNGIFAGA